MGTVIPLYKQAGVEQSKLPSYLQKLYDDGKSQQEIAQIIGCHRTTIENAFRKFKLKSRPYTECDLWLRKSCTLSDREYECLDGILLGDGHLDKSSISGRLTYGCKYRQTLFDIEKALPHMKFGPHWQSRKTKCWHFKSSFYNNLISERERWYPNGRKEIPKDVRLTPLSCYWWFIGDGYQVDYGIMLCTDSFGDDSILIKKLAEVGFDSHKSSNRLRIAGKSAPKFLQWIKPKVIPKQYKYKWESHRRQHA